MPEKRWKAQERRIARLLNGHRNPNTGAAAPDVETEWLCVEVKDREELPAWIHAALATARGHAGGNRLGIAVLSSRTEVIDLVVMDLRDFRDWFIGKGKEAT